MKYLSTRGKITGLSFEDALLSGYAADGGMLLPESVPRLDKQTIQQWASLSYKELVKNIMHLFISETEIPRQDINDIVDRAYSRFDDSKVVVCSNLDKGLNILELFHGPTLAFKDLALSCVGQLLEYFLEKSKKHITIVVGTSGDTGSAAIESVRGLRWVDIVVLLPKGRCSRVQELQMTTVIDDNVHVYRMDGTADDLDLPIRQCFLDEEFVSKHTLCSINSINWARVMVQIAHFFYSYFQVCPGCDGEVQVVAPTGACGNVTGGVIARAMGLPIKLVCTVNSNDIIDRAFTNGDYSIADEVIDTIAPAMNIQVPYNMERILYLVNGHNAKDVCTFMEHVDSSGKATLNDDLRAKINIKSCSVDDEGIRSAMKRCWKENKYLVCPHSATAVWYHYDQLDRFGPPSCPSVCLATASPAKFEEAVLSAGLTPQPTEGVKNLEHMPTKYVDMEKTDDWLKLLNEKIEAIFASRH